MCVTFKATRNPPSTATAQPLDDWLRLVRYFERGVKRLPDKTTLDRLPRKKVRYFQGRMRGFAREFRTIAQAGRGA